MKTTALLAVGLNGVLAAAQTNGSNPSEVPYYGRSPPVYPSRKFLMVAISMDQYR